LRVSFPRRGAFAAPFAFLSIAVCRIAGVPLA
jgi:hypothetical protein